MKKAFGFYGVIILCLLGGFLQANSLKQVKEKIVSGEAYSPRCADSNHDDCYQYIELLTPVAGGYLKSNVIKFLKTISGATDLSVEYVEPCRKFLHQGVEKDMQLLVSCMAKVTYSIEKEVNPKKLQ